jgi:hypothetical protein
MYGTVRRIWQGMSHRVAGRTMRMPLSSVSPTHSGQNMEKMLV